MKFFSEQIIVIPQELFGFKIDVFRSRRKTSFIQIAGNVLRIKVPNKVKDRKNS